VKYVIVSLDVFSLVYVCVCVCVVCVGDDPLTTSVADLSVTSDPELSNFLGEFFSV